MRNINHLKTKYNTLAEFIFAGVFFYKSGVKRRANPSLNVT